MSTEPLAIDACGAWTSLGALVPAAAAARAGMSNARALAVDGARGAAGHAAPALEPDAGGRTRALLHAASLDLARALAERKAPPGRVGIYLGLGRDDDTADAPELVAAALSARPLETKVFAAGRAGTVRALAAAFDAIGSRRVDRAVVGGVESKVEPRRLAAAAAAGRLKTEDYPVGVIPGEAAALVSLEAASPASTAEALVFAPATAVEAQSFERGGPAIGRALAAVLVGALDGQVVEGGSVLVDLNGEPYRATDWAMAVVRTRARAAVDRLDMQLPALWFGDVGAAYPALAMALAARAFVRGYAPGPVALVCASSDGGERAAFAVKPLS
jgi:3-oxoacyl-[acyl-carrier-protein] synthase I